MNNNITFGSRNNPINPFLIKTKIGNLNVREFTLNDKNIEKEILDTADLFVYNFATNTKDPTYLCLPFAPKQIYKSVVEGFARYIKNVLQTDDGNVTYLIAKNQFGKTEACCMTSSLNAFGSLNEPNSLYVSNIAVNKSYRGNKVGSTMVNKIIEASYNRFSDLVLVADNCAVPAYKKRWNLEEFKPKDEIQEKVFNLMRETQDDYPEYVTFMHKPLDITQERWWEKLAKLIAISR